MDLKYCRYEKDGHVARITITRPEVMNALHQFAHAELDGVWDDFAADDEDVDDEDGCILPLLGEIGVAK